MTKNIGGLGEIALRVKDLNSMQDFYSNVVGLPLMKRFPNAAFFRIAEGFAGHTQILALFDRSNHADYVAPNPSQTTIDHLAFSVSADGLESERERLSNLGVAYTTAAHGWVRWRSIYIHDPEGNMVEFVCYDKSIMDDT